MPLEYVTIMNAAVQALQDYNTTTAALYLSQSISTGQLDVSNIMMNDPEVVAVRMDRLPALFVRMSSDDPQEGAIGRPGVTTNRTKSFTKVHMDIVGLCRKDGGRQDFSTLLVDTYNLARNVDGILRHEFTLSGTVMWCRRMRTDFLATFDDQGRWTRGFIMQMEAEVNYR